MQSAKASTPLNPTFIYIEKLGYTGVYIIILSTQK